MDTPQTILAITDNHRTGSVIRQALDTSDLSIAGYTLAQSGDIHASLASVSCDCVLLDTDIPAPRVEDVLGAVRAAWPQPAVVALVADQPAPGVSDGLAVEQYLPLAALTPAMLSLIVRNAVRIKRAAAQHTAHGAEQPRSDQILDLLADVSRALADSNDHYACLANTANYIIERFADWCAIDLVTDAEWTRVVLASRTADTTRIDMFSDNGTPQEPAAFFPPQTKNTGKPRFSPTLIVVPLCARQQTLGAVTFVRNDTSARFVSADRTLAEEIGRRIAIAVDNELLYRTSQESMRARDVFLSVAAHELKTPLTALLGYATLLKRRLERGTQQPERDLRGVNIMVEQAQRLSKLLNTLLEIARMPHTPLNPEQSQCNLSQLTRRVTKEMRAVLRYHTLDVHVPEAAVVVAGDAERLELVLHNLLQNAVQYSPAGGVITVTLTHGDHEACLSIQDHGVGIPREALPRIFGRFYRARDTSVHTATGMGVGLYIVKQIVESHGGYVDVQSVEGVGSTFTVCLPLYHPRELPTRR